MIVAHEPAAALDLAEPELAIANVQALWLGQDPVRSPDGLDAVPTGKRGWNQTGQTILRLFGMALHQTQAGHAGSLLGTLSRRQECLALNIPEHGARHPLHLLIDSTGIALAPIRRQADAADRLAHPVDASRPALRVSPSCPSKAARTIEALSQTTAPARHVPPWRICRPSAAHPAAPPEHVGQDCHPALPRSDPVGADMFDPAAQILHHEGMATKPHQRRASQSRPWAVTSAGLSIARH